MKIGIAGCAGRMGRALIRQVINVSYEAGTGVLSGGVEQMGCEAIGRDLGHLAGLDVIGVKVSGDVRAVFDVSDVVIDFTLPAVTREHARLAVSSGTALVIGTTGLDARDNAAIDRAAAVVPVVQAGNMSVGVNLLCGLVEQVAGALGEDFDIEIAEMHHRHKTDAPSGTALMLGQAAADGRGVDLGAVSRRGRDGRTGARKAGDIGFAALRGGGVVGDHTVIFAADAERIELTHRATDRGLFAAGAVRAALWCDGRAPGRYSMRDVLGLSPVVASDHADT